MKIEPFRGERLSEPLASVRHKSRLLVLLHALERVGVAPVRMKRLHAFAYLADVLSPVWGLVPYDGVIYKMEAGPHYSDLQRELDDLVLMGLVDILDLRYIDAGADGAWIDGLYQLNFESNTLHSILDLLGVGNAADALDPRDVERNAHLVELAHALSTLDSEELDEAAKVDATYSSKAYQDGTVIDFREAKTTLDDGAQDVNKSVAVTEKFVDFFPNSTNLSSSERIYLYANYLGRRMQAV